jgi:hypothetical protein
MRFRVFEFLARVHGHGDNGKGANENPAFLLLYVFHRLLIFGVDRSLKKNCSCASKSLYANPLLNTLNQQTHGCAGVIVVFTKSVKRKAPLQDADL